MWDGHYRSLPIPTLLILPSRTQEKAQKQGAELPESLRLVQS